MANRQKYFITLKKELIPPELSHADLQHRAGFRSQAVKDALTGQRAPRLDTLYRILHDGIGLSSEEIHQLRFGDIFLVQDIHASPPLAE